MFSRAVAKEFFSQNRIGAGSLKSVDVDCWVLTGATGLVGRFVLAELLRNGNYVATLVRDRASASARLRIEESIEPFESDTSLIRPRVIAFDLTRPGLGISDADRRWLQGKRLGVIHSAASIRFQGTGPDAEPYLSNVRGTENLLNFLRDCDVECFHYVSTAYVTSRSGDPTTAHLPRREVEVARGASGGNDYESSKIQSERMILDCSWLKSKTILRPSIIVGDSQTYYSSTFHGFYAALQIANQVVKLPGSSQLGGGYFRKQLGLSERDTKNFVTVDWVARAIVRIALNPKLHGRIYHLTNPQTVSCADVQAAIEEALQPQISRDAAQYGSSPLDPQASQSSMPGSFREQLAVYETYFNCDPAFDCSNTLAVLPDLPCPRVSVELLVSLARFALQANFGWPRPSVTLPEHAQAFNRIEPSPALQDVAESIELQVLGVGAPPPMYFSKHRGRWTATECLRAGAEKKLTLVGRSKDIASCLNGMQSLSGLARAGWLACVGKPPKDLNEILLELERDLKSPT